MGASLRVNEYLVIGLDVLEQHVPVVDSVLDILDVLLHVCARAWISETGNHKFCLRLPHSLADMQSR